MSFPNVIYGDFGDEKRAQSTKINGMPLGVVMILPDGRQYIHGKASTAAALSAGYICCGSVITAAGTSVANGLVAATAAVGATSVVVTLAAGTAFVANQWNEGWLSIASSTGTGRGMIYKIKSSNSAAAEATATISLYEEDAIHTAIEGGTSRVGLKDNQLNNVVVAPTGTSLPGTWVGVPQVATSAGFYTWFARKGYSTAYVTTGTALVVGDPCFASTAYAGAFGPIVAGTAGDSRSYMVLGTVATLNSNTTGFCVVDLSIGASG